MKSVMFVLGHMGNGGAERVVSLLSNRLADNGIKVYVVTIFSKQTDYTLNNNIIRQTVDCNSNIKILMPIKRIAYLKQYIKKYSPGCVISFLAEVNIYTVVAMFGSNVPLILSERNDPNSDPDKIYKRWIRNYLYRYCDGIIFQTDEAKKYFSKLLKKDCFQDIIYNPLSDDLPKKNDWNEKKRFITACRLDVQKNLPMMISAISEVIDEGYDCSLDIYGRGPLYADLEKYITKLGKQKQIRIMGFSKNIHYEMCNSVAFIITSDYEGLSNSMIEALAVGIPVIATDCPIGGARKFVINNENGFLIPVNGKEELKNCIRSVLNNEYSKKKISESADYIREILNIDKILNQWIVDVDYIIAKKQEG